MRKVFTLVTILLIAFAARAQTQPAPAPAITPYGKIDKADLEMTSCDFEKDANAEVLLDLGVMPSFSNYIIDRLTRIKIFNEKGKGEANIRIIYNGLNGIGIIDLQAETINLENGMVKITPLDKKSTYIEKIDKFTSALVFSMPNVKSGSVIEFKYRAPFQPTWYFQSDIPTRYSELRTDFPGTAKFRLIPHITMPYTKNIGDAMDFTQTKSLSNVPAFHDEPFMTSREENLQRMEYIDMNVDMLNTWEKVGEELMKFFDYSNVLNRNLTDEKNIIKYARTLKNDDDKIAFVFDTVKNQMKWNNSKNWFISDGTLRAWDNKTGNSAEINLIVYDLLKKSGVNAHVMLVGDKTKSKINPYLANPYAMSSLVVYIPVDSERYYVLDATNKYNLFNVVPKDNLNTFGLMLDNDNKVYKTIFIENTEPSVRSVFLSAEIKPDGKMAGNAQISSSSYNRIDDLNTYNTDGKEKYIDYLTNNKNNIKITSLNMSNMDKDSLPLTQDISFNMDLAGADDGYIYFSPNLFTQLDKNPFLSENRYSDIDFGYRDNLVLSGEYKLPAGYSVDALPKNITLMMPDSSIIFRRMIGQQDGTITVRYVINHKKSMYFKTAYPEFYEFYRKMYDMLNEQIVLKKS
jgi:hypothetical protein